MLYAAYCRVSSEEQSKDETIDIQIDILKAYFEKNNIIVPEKRWYLDDGVSGELILRDRPAGAKLLLDALDGRLTHLVIVRVNRIARDDYAAQEAFHTLKKMGVSLISLSEPFNYFEPSGQMMATVFSSFAAYDRATIKQNFSDGKARKARQGKLPQGAVPFGYKLNKEDMSVWIYDEQAEVVRLVYKLYIEDNLSIKAIAEYLSSMKIPAPADYKTKWYRNHKRKGGWCEYSVNNILRSDIYTGIYPYKPPGKNPIPVPIPQIIDPETYFKARKIAKTKRLFYAPNSHREYLLRGMVFCGVCSSAYVGTSSGKGRFAYYRCTKKKSSEMSCTNQNINADILEDSVWEDLCSTFRNPNKLIAEVAEELKVSTRLDDYVTEIEEVIKRLDEVALERKRLLDLYAKGTLAEKELFEAITERDDSLKTLQERKAFLEQQIRIEQNHGDFINSVPIIAEQIERMLDNATEESKMSLFRTLINRVEIMPGESPEIRVSYRFGNTMLNDLSLVK